VTAVPASRVVIERVTETVLFAVAKLAFLGKETQVPAVCTKPLPTKRRLLVKTNAPVDPAELVANTIAIHRKRERIRGGFVEDNYRGPDWLIKPVYADSDIPTGTEINDACADGISIVGTDGTGTVVGGGPISAETARRMLCDAEVSRILTDPTGAILEKGRSIRTATMDQRQALIVRDGGCAFPGCDRGPEWCDAHHIIHWAHPACGRTDLANLLL
jgi:hypothetical protein